VKCNGTSISKHFEPSNQGATAEAAFLLFLSTQKVKAPAEGHPAKADFRRRGGGDNPLYYAKKGGRVIDRVEVLRNLNGGGYYVESYEVCPLND
jgi:hypothetical protein